MAKRAGAFTSDTAGIGEMLCAPFMQKEMLRRARKARDRARASAPVGDRSDRSRGSFKKSIKATSGIQSKRTRRAYGAIVSDDPAAYPIEMGTSDTPRHRTLRNAMEAMGD